MLDEKKLHGYVVGLGVMHKDGSKDFRWLEKPVHNRIVSCGLDAYFQFNGSNTATTTSGDFDNRFLSAATSSSVTKGGLLQYMAIGTNGSETRFDDTALKNQVGGYSRDYTFYSQPYTGWCINSDKTISTRTQVTSIAVSEHTEVREIGFFEKYSNSDTYVMFSRIALPSAVVLESGDKLLTCYQLDITYNGIDETPVPSSLLSGLVDVDGNPLVGYESTRIYTDSTDSPAVFGKWYNTAIGAEVVKGGTSPITGANPSSIVGYRVVAPFKAPYNTSNYNDCQVWSRSTSGWAMQIQFGRNTTYTSQRLNDSDSYLNFEYANPLGYVPGTYYRDRKIIVSASWPNNTASGYKDIYAIAFNCKQIRFGYFDASDNWVEKPWRKEFGKRYEFIYRTKLTTADTL